MELFLLTITIFGATNMMALQGALAQNNYQSLSNSPNLREVQII
ncbi:MAG: hypothetical protein K0S93_1599 [Nitrososphaeraceae archaeon]|jgi:hypothetical protein|nr:hypothetical protein [Nitrososphaeraceae archaeon]